MNSCCECTRKIIIRGLRSGTIMGNTACCACYPEANKGIIMSSTTSRGGDTHAPRQQRNMIVTPRRNDLISPKMKSANKIPSPAQIPSPLTDGGIGVAGNTTSKFYDSGEGKGAGGVTKESGRDAEKAAVDGRKLRTTMHDSSPPPAAAADRGKSRGKTKSKESKDYFEQLNAKDEAGWGESMMPGKHAVLYTPGKITKGVEDNVADFQEDLSMVLEPVYIFINLRIHKQPRMHAN